MHPLPQMTLSPEPLRRAVLLALLAIGGAGLAALAILGPDLRAGGRGVALLAGAGLLFAARQVWRQRGQALVLDADALRTTDGEVVALLASVQRVDSGALSAAPPGGFALTLAAPGPARWVPGLWWRLGNRVGVGGLVPKPRAQAAAQALRVSLALRQPR